MLAEIFMLRLETMMRRPEDHTRLANARFVPFRREAASQFGGRQAGDDGKQA